MSETVAEPVVVTPVEPQNQTEVFAVHGADPEVLAYAMAKYSRSSLSMKDSLKEISSQRAEQFLNTFYFQYGHRSIADLAHIAFAIERLSLLAAISLVDEQRWDGQERSTRYQNFKKSGWYMPDFGPDRDAAQLYRESVEGLFTAYHELTENMFERLKQQVEKPSDMKQESYERTLKARAFDIGRYLLPLATNTSLGQIVNARTLETQVSRLLSSSYAEIRQLGERLRAAATGPAWNVHAEELAGLQNEIAALDPAPVVDLVERKESLEAEIAATLLYSVSHYPYRQLRDQVAALDEARIHEIIALGTRHRGRHDELLREFSAGQTLRFDILMDIGGFRDMHRHRRCVQIIQSYTTAHGYDLPEGVVEAGLQPQYEAAMQCAHAAHAKLATKAAESADYLLPLGTRMRALFKMDFAEALYISELRSQPQGHFSYRRVAWEMYEAVRKQHPSLAGYFRVTDVNEPIDLLKR